MRPFWWPVVYFYAVLHCLFRHGANLQESDDSHGRKVLRCPVCGRTFWRE
jgi:hypothetical protein